MIHVTDDTSLESLSRLVLLEIQTSTVSVTAVTIGAQTRQARAAGSEDFWVNWKTGRLVCPTPP